MSGRQPSTRPTDENHEYLVMPFDLTNAPAVFQALINDVHVCLPGQHPDLLPKGGTHISCPDYPPMSAGVFSLR